MTTYEVKMGVPLPSKFAGKKTPLRSALESLPVGGMLEADRGANAVRAAVETVKKYNGFRLAVRALANGRLGIWRTA